MAESTSRDRPTTDLGAKASSSQRASSQAQALACAASEVCSACGAALPLRRASAVASSDSFTSPCVVTSEMVEAGLNAFDVLFDSHPPRLLVEEIYTAMTLAAPHGVADQDA